MITLNELLAVEDSSLKKLTITTKLTGEETDPVWQMVRRFYSSKSPNLKGHLFHNLAATVMNSCLTELKTEFLLSRSIVENLMKQDCQISRKTISGKELDVFFAKAKAAGMIVELEAPSKFGGDGAKAGMYRIEVVEVVQYIEQKLSDGTQFSNSLPVVEVTVKERPGSEQIASREEIPQGHDGHPEDFETSFKPDDELIPSEDSERCFREAESNFLQQVQTLPALGPGRDEWSAFGSRLCEMVKLNTVALFNAWGDHCGDRMPDSKIVDRVICTALQNRFTDKTGKWSLSGEIANSAKALIKKMIPQNNSGVMKPKNRDCSPSKWKMYRRVASIIEKKEEWDFQQQEFGMGFMSEDEETLANQPVTEAEMAIYEEIKAKVDPTPFYTMLATEQQNLRSQMSQIVA